ncbi:AcrR family transcriptional regulator [Arthrobacter sp. UYCu712]
MVSPDSGAADTGGRILAAAYELLSRRGVRDVGINELISRSEVAKATFYRHFRSKDDAVLASLAQRDQGLDNGPDRRRRPALRDDPRRATAGHL